MKVLIRIISFLLGIAVIGTLLMVLGFILTTGALAQLIRIGLFGAWTILGWILILCAGPFAAVQLWRFRPSGRVVGLVLFANAALYYTVGAWIFAKPEANMLIVLISATLNILGFVLLLSSSAQKQFARDTSISVDQPNDGIQRTANRAAADAER